MSGLPLSLRPAALLEITYIYIYIHIKGSFAEKRPSYQKLVLDCQVSTRACVPGPGNLKGA